VTARQILLAAASMLERDGWCQGSSQDEKGRRCGSGAITDTCPPGNHGAEWVRARNAVREQIGSEDIAVWNDVHGRTADEVIAALRAAAERCAS
jgi:hypothetical protein